MSDLISRQAAIDKFNRFIERCIKEHTGRVVFTIDDAKYAFIKAVESVEPVPCDSCIWEVCNYNKVDWDALPSAEPYRIDPDGTAWVNAQGQDLDKVGRVILDNHPYAKTFYPDRPRGKWIGEMSYDECDQCHFKTIYGYNFCPNCGADMRGGENVSKP